MRGRSRKDPQDAAVPTPAKALQMLNGIFVVQKPLARFAMAHSASPPTHKSFDPLLSDVG